MVDDPKPGNPPPPKPEDAVSLPKAEADVLTALKARYTPPEGEYDLKLPEGTKLDPSIVKKTAALARKLGLSQQDALELHNSTIQELTAREAALEADNKPETGAAWKAREAQWASEAVKDADIGGTPEKLKESATLAKKVLEHFGAEDVKEFLAVSGLGSHPGVIKLLVKIGRGMKEADFIKSPGTKAGSEGEKKTPAQRMYGKTTASKETA